MYYDTSLTYRGCKSAHAVSPEYLFHSASTDADGSSGPGRCPKILLKKLLDMLALAQCVPSVCLMPVKIGSISTIGYEDAVSS